MYYVLYVVCVLMCNVLCVGCGVCYVLYYVCDVLCNVLCNVWHAFVWGLCLIGV